MASGYSSMTLKRRRNSVIPRSTLQIPTDSVGLRRSSDPVRLVCKVCMLKGTRTEATKFCEKCQKHMCSFCLQNHENISQRLHSPQEHENERSQDHIIHYDCVIHKSKAIKYYCTNHNVLGCSECIANRHQRCETNVLYIPEVVTHIESHEVTEDYDEILKKLNTVHKHVCNSKTGLKSKEEVIEETKQRALLEVQTLRRKLNELLDKVEMDIEEKANIKKNNDMEKIKVHSQEYDYMTANIESMIAELKDKYEAQQNLELFIAMKTADTSIGLICEKLGELEEENLVSNYEFVPQKQVEDLMSGKIKLGSIRKERSVKHLTTIKVGSSKDKKASWITGLVELSSNCIVLADHENACIKMVDMKASKITSRLLTSSPPWDITKIREGTLAVTLPDEKKIQMISAGKSLTCANTIQVDGECCGLACADQRLLVSYTYPAKIQVLDLHNATVLMTIATDKNGQQLFSNPFYLSVSPTHNYIYVSDTSDHTVTCLMMDGSLVTRYKSYSLTGPMGIATDNHGTVNVCGGWSKTIHSLKPSCSQGKDIIRNFDDPQSIAISENQRILYIGTIASNKVSVYEID